MQNTFLCNVPRYQNEQCFWSEGLQVLPACSFDKRELLKWKWVRSIREITLQTEVSPKVHVQEFGLYYTVTTGCLHYKHQPANDV